ncbi:imm11 family protein [Bradyrhizobium oligotrophicum]|uniref:imm11 family protein n=1 Tax=Bradyrhizobium oligotrophicum TaxID=44255 RepID=UPI003EB8D8E9
MYEYGSDALDGDVDKVAFEEPVPYALELYSPWRGFGGGARVSSRHMPTRLRLKGRKRKLLDFDNQYHMLLVSRRFIDLVESLQKDIQVFPVQCVWGDGSDAGQFYFFFTTVLLDAVNRERTNANWVPTARGGLWQPRAGEIFSFDKDRMGDVHMWIDPHMPTKGPLVSEALFRRLQDADVRSFYDAPLFEEV